MNLSLGRLSLFTTDALTVVHSMQLMSISEEGWAEA